MNKYYKYLIVFEDGTTCGTIRDTLVLHNAHAVKYRYGNRVLGLCLLVDDDDKLQARFNNADQYGEDNIHIDTCTGDCYVGLVGTEPCNVYDKMVIDGYNKAKGVCDD